MKKKLNLVVIMILIMSFCVITQPQTADAAAKKVQTKTGTYNGSSRVLVVHKVTNKKIVFEIGYTAMQEARSGKITAKIKNGKAKFDFTDDWGNSGKGVLVLHKKYVYFKTNDTNSLIGTEGKKVKLKWVTSKKEFSYYAEN